MVDKNKNESFVSRLRLACDKANISPENKGRNKELAKKLQVSSETARKWLAGTNMPTEKHRDKLAQKLGVNRAWLFEGVGPINGSQTKEPQADYNFETVDLSKKDEVPVISMVQAGDWSEAVDPYPTGEGVETLPCPYPHGENTFAVKVKGDSMYPEFREGMIIFIDPSKMPENKDYCIAKLDETNEATFKQYVIEDGQKFLKATNPDWPQKYISINGNCHLVGKLIGVYQKY